MTKSTQHISKSRQIWEFVKNNNLSGKNCSEIASHMNVTSSEISPLLAFLASRGALRVRKESVGTQKYFSVGDSYPLREHKKPRAKKASIVKKDSTKKMYTNFSVETLVDNMTIHDAKIMHGILNKMFSFRT